MPTGKPNPKALTLREQLEHEMAQIQERLRLEDIREQQAAKLAKFLTDHAFLLPRSQILKVIKALPPDPDRLNGAAATATLGVKRRGMNPPSGALGTAIRKARMDKGWTLTVAGKKIGVNGGSISGWENGHFKPQDPKLHAKIKSVLGVDAAKILAP